MTKERLQAYNILDTLPEKKYDDITYLASCICDTPIALISLLTEEKQWFKSAHGLASTETPIEQSFCLHAVNSRKENLIVADSRQDPRFQDNPLVTGEPHVIFYAGCPLVNEKGEGLGTLCVIDTKPRELTEKQLKALRILGDQVMEMLDLRKAYSDLHKASKQLATHYNTFEEIAIITNNEIKSPLTVIQMANDDLASEMQNLENSDAGELIKKSNHAVINIKTLVEKINKLSLNKN